MKVPKGEALSTDIGKKPDIYGIYDDQQAAAVGAGYPSVDVKVNRELAGQLGVTANQVARSLSEATYSSGFTSPNY